MIVLYKLCMVYFLHEMKQTCCKFGNYFSSHLSFYIFVIPHSTFTFVTNGIVCMKSHSFQPCTLSWHFAHFKIITPRCHVKRDICLHDFMHVSLNISRNKDAW
jgi:hypothetical protein